MTALHPQYYRNTYIAIFHNIVELRKVMVRDEFPNECIECGRTLRTGRKYCYLHRSLGRTSSNKHNSLDRAFMIVFLLAMVGTAFAYVMYWLYHLLIGHPKTAMTVCFVFLLIEAYRLGVKGMNDTSRVRVIESILTAIVFFIFFFLLYRVY